jgi:hypothetical protein
MLKTLRARQLLFRAAQHARAETGKGILSQFIEIARLRRGDSALHPRDYYAFRVFDDRAYSAAAKGEVVSWRHKVLGSVNDPQWRAVVRDKLNFYALIHSLGFPHPEVFALYQADGRPFGIAPTLRTVAEMATFFRTSMRYPFFAKPVNAAFGRGTSSVDSFDRESDRLLLAGGEEIGLDDYVARYGTAHHSGMLFQERVVQNPEVVRMCGPAASTLRMVVLNYEEGPRVFRCTWNIPVGPSIISNYERGKTGNLKAWIDVANGYVEDMIRAHPSKPGHPYVPGEFGVPAEAHPDTGVRLVGVTVPGWDAAVELCLRGARGFPGLRYQAWDIVLSDRGPLVMELNFEGGPQQFPGKPGLNDAELRAFMKRYLRGSNGAGR